MILLKSFKPYMLCSFRYKLVTFSIALIPVILWPVFLILSLCFLWPVWFVVNFANFVIFLTVYRNILQALCFSHSGSVTCCRSETKPEHKPHQRSETQPSTAKRNTTERKKEDLLTLPFLLLCHYVVDCFFCLAAC